MDYDGDGSSGNEHYTSENSSKKEKKKIFHRHTPQQIEILESCFKEYPNPDKSQRQQLCNILNLEVAQIKFWFQNKRTQCKAKYERSSNMLLREENEKLKGENEVMGELLKNAICPPCGGSPFNDEECRRNLQKLRLENVLLKEKRDRLANFVFNNKNGPTMMDSSDSARKQQSVDPHTAYGTNSNNIFEPSCSLGPRNSQTIQPQQQPSQMNITKLSEMAASAIEELKWLFFTEEALWVKSYIDGTYVIDQNSYGELSHVNKHFNNLNAPIESSRDITLVPIEATSLIEMFLDADKWKSLFPTIVNKAKSLHIGSEPSTKENFIVLQVIWEQLHILSPLVPPREFMILRCCQQIDEGLWIVADVSQSVVNFDITSTPCYKRPSGCLIRALPNARSEVTWIEHVEVDDKSDIHRMYRPLLCGGLGYGARRWIATLKRMCERMALSSILIIPATDYSEAITTLDGRKSVMSLGERMLKNFNEMLTMSGKVDFPQYSNCGVRVSTRLNTEDGQPPGLIVSAASSLLIPLTPLHVFNCLRNIHTRHQWDVLCSGNIPSEIARVFTGSSETNSVSILRPTQTHDTTSVMLMAQDSYKNGMSILQDCYMDALGGMIVYAPLDTNTMNMVVSGQVDTSAIPILPSGFIISSDGRRSMAAAQDDGATLLTVVYQILVTGRTTPATRELNEKSADNVSSLISAAVQRIKVLLNCPHV